ncbi:MAG: hypothetical protein ACRCY4_03105 [Brevinema sp.]
MVRQVGILKILPAIMIGFFVARMMNRGDMHDIVRFIISVILYSAGFLLIIWSLTSGRKKPVSAPKKQDTSTKKEQADKENSENT